MDAENRDSIINETYEKGKIQDLEVENPLNQAENALYLQHSNQLFLV